VKSAFVPRLINGPFGDPGLHVTFKWGAEALQFDLGRLDRLPAAEILKVRHVFVSHTHMDHFYGFDRMLRLFLARDARLAIHGPPGIIANVCGKIAGYTWNLTDGYPLVIDVHEVDVERMRSVRLAAAQSFRPEELGEGPFRGRLVDTESFTVDAVHLDHRIPSMAFAFQEMTHLNVRSSELEQMGVTPGRWLNELKLAIRAGADDAMLIEAPTRTSEGTSSRRWSLRELRDRLVIESPGQKIGYIVDTIFSQANADKVVALMAGADCLFCESLFLDEDRHEARKRYHLTARQAGTLARMANVRMLRTFHFSPRYEGQADRLYTEAQAAFRGEIPPDEPFF
jgi:ribonuclease Z